MQGCDWITHYPQSISTCRSHFNTRCKLSLSPSFSSILPSPATGLALKWTPHLKLLLHLRISRGIFIQLGDINVFGLFKGGREKKGREKKQTQTEIEKRALFFLFSVPCAFHPDLDLRCIDLERYTSQQTSIQ